MKQIYTEKAVILDDNGIVVYHPTTVFTNDTVEVNQFDNELIVSGLQSVAVDNIINQLAEKQVPVDVVWLEDAPRTQQSDEATNKLIESGVTIITVES